MNDNSEKTNLSPHWGMKQTQLKRVFLKNTQLKRVFLKNTQLKAVKEKPNDVKVEDNDDE
jgi:hypothetical protein